MKVETISVESASCVVIHNKLYRQDTPNQRLVVLLPGRGYTVDSPIMHYLGRIARQRGYDVLTVKYYFHITQGEFDPDQLPVAVYDAKDALVEALKFGYKEVIFAGKSLGTPIIPQLLAYTEDLKCACLMLTPILNSVEAVKHLPTLAIIGTADSAYNPATAVSEGLVTWNVYEGLNHSLEALDWRESLAVLPEIMSACDDFITGQAGQ